MWELFRIMIKDVRMHTLCRNLAFDNEATCQVIRVFHFVCLSVCVSVKKRLLEKLSTDFHETCS